MQNAVRQVFVDKCFSYTNNGINANGKCVEVKFTKSIIYSSTGAAGTYGIKLRSPGGTSFYNEGWHFTDCTIDNFETTFDVTDIFVLTVTGGYLGSIGGGYVALFGQPASNLCIDIKFTGVPMSGRVEFAPTGGRDYGAVFSGCQTVAGPSSGYAIHIANNASGISIKGHKFRNGGAGTIAIRAQNNNSRIVVQGIDVDSTYTGGAVFIQGSAGSDCSISGVAYAGAGEQIFIERPVLISGLMAATATGALIKRNINSGSISGSYTVGSTIVTLSGRFAKGETGLIIARFQACSGLDAATQRFDIGLPAGLVAPTGTGWDSKLIFPGVTTGVVQFVVPYHCTADIPLASGNITITNAAGNTATIGGHSWAAIEHNF
jgi:hypothetical protein